MMQAVITIDTEAPAGITPVDSLIYGKTEGDKEYGIRALMDLFEKYQYTGLFFVDIAEAWDYGEKEITGVIECIKSRGHDVGVHVHPDHMADPNRRFLWEYSYDEQYEIISRCTAFYEKVLGTRPLSFRAGRYGANDDTIKVLQQLHYKYDFSEFPHNKRCGMSFDGKYNQIKEIPGTSILEIPVSVFQSFRSPFYSRFDKVDVAQSLGEYKKVIDSFDADEMIVFFAHSFSMLNWRKNPDRPRVNKSEYKKIDDMLEYLHKKNINVFREESLEECRRHNGNGYISLAKGVGQYLLFSKRAYTTLHDRIVRNV